jgi:hypothetical protein
MDEVVECRELVIGDADEYDPYRVSGARNKLILDPSTPRVYLFRTVGAGIPMGVHKRTEIALDLVPPTVVPETLVEWLRTQTDALLALADRYQGEHWDGNNYVGRWDWTGEYDDSAPTEIGLEQAIEDGTVTQYWEADAYLQPVVSDLIDELLDGLPLSDLVSREEAAARGAGAVLRPGDVREYLIHELLYSTPVCGGEPGTEDYDEGEISEVLEDDTVMVAWESCCCTPAMLSELRRV